MKSFKQILAGDIKSTFLNLDEFGETHTINGREMTIIVDANEVEERGKKQFTHPTIDGIYEDNILIYVSRKTFGKQPAHGQELKLDGKAYRIEDSRDEGGVLSITLVRYQS